MRAHEAVYRTKAMCHTLAVSRSGYYDWVGFQQRGPSTRRLVQQARDAQVKQAFEQRKERSGAPNLTRDLHDAGQSCNRKTVAKSLQRRAAPHSMNTYSLAFMAPTTYDS
jgi:putative transposase